MRCLLWHRKQKRSNILFQGDTGPDVDTGGAVTYCICIYICTQVYASEMTHTSSFLRLLERERERKKNQLDVLLLTNATTHTHKMWMFDEMQKWTVFCHNYQSALCNLVSCL